MLLATGRCRCAGRDHWGPCGCALFAGGPTNPGAVLGATDSTAAYPTDLPVTPADVTATIFHALGLDPSTEMHDRLNRPLPISTGKVIREVFV